MHEAASERKGGRRQRASSEYSPGPVRCSKSANSEVAQSSSLRVRRDERAAVADRSFAGFDSPPSRNFSTLDSPTAQQLRTLDSNCSACRLSVLCSALRLTASLTAPVSAASSMDALLYVSNVSSRELYHL